MGALDNLKNNSAGNSSSNTTVGNVYLGTTNEDATTQSPTGTTYKIKGKKDKVVSAFQAKQDYLKDTALRNQWTALLAKYGLKTDPISAKTAYDNAVDGASEWYGSSGGLQKVTPQQYLAWYASAKNLSSTGSSLPSRQIYNYTEADRLKIIDDASQALRGQGITEEDKNTAWYKNLKKSIDAMISTGTVTSTKQVKNPKTGKLESVSTTTPGFSQEAATAAAEQAIKAGDPTDVARKERVDFTSWLFNNLGGK